MKVREWVVEASTQSEAYGSSRRERPRGRRVRVAGIEDFGEKGWLVEEDGGGERGKEGGFGRKEAEEGDEIGREGGEGGTKWLLIHSGCGGEKKRVVRTGDVVEVMRPTWDVQMKGEVWKAGVEWMVVEGDR